MLRNSSVTLATENFFYRLQLIFVQYLCSSSCALIFHIMVNLWNLTHGCYLQVKTLSFV